MPSKTIEDFAYQVRDYMRSAEVVEGKNHAYSQENNAVIATIENGKSYKVRWTGSATVTLKKDSASGTEITSGSTSPLSFTADADYDLYFGSSADVTEIMVYDGASTDDTYEPYYVPVKELMNNKADITAIATEENGATASKAYNIGEHFYKDGKFCTAITSIGSGATLTLNTNYIADTIGNSLYKNSMMNDYYSATACVLLSNQTKTYITINNSKYQLHFMIISGNAGGSVFMGLLNRKYDDSLFKVLLGGTDIIASGHVICENTGDRGFTLKFPNFGGGCQIWILSISGTTLGGITTGIYT